MISGAAMVAGVVGAPVAHSLSPYLHGRWIAAAGLDAAYVPFAPPPGRFAAFVEAFRGGVIRGLNVTAPFKREALALADRADAAAIACGSANLLLFDAGGSIEARSTDGHGVLVALARRAPALHVARALVLGAGGAGAAACAALLGAGWRVAVWNRTPGRAADLAGALPGLVAEADPQAALADLEVTLLVNALPVAPDLALARGPGLAVLDMSYRPHWTPLLAAARDAGATPVHGLDMLIAQAEPSFEALFGRPPPDLPDLRDAAIAAAGQ
jgi:shikimate dehydrogenase